MDTYERWFKWGDDTPPWRATVVADPTSSFVVPEGILDARQVARNARVYASARVLLALARDVVRNTYMGQDFISPDEAVVEAHDVLSRTTRQIGGRLMYDITGLITPEMLLEGSDYYGEQGEDLDALADERYGDRRVEV